MGEQFSFGTLIAANCFMVELYIEIFKNNAVSSTVFSIWQLNYQSKTIFWKQFHKVSLYQQV